MLSKTFYKNVCDELIVVVFAGENQAICFKFATHMFGNGVGSLRVWFRPSDSGSEGSDQNSNRILWEMSGDSGNNWNMAQLPIASASGFQIAFEGVVGSNYLGNIAIDSISLEPGSCPSQYPFAFMSQVQFVVMH